MLFIVLRGQFYDGKGILCYLWGPQEIRLEFREKNVESNRTALRVVALILCVIELYNICRVLFLSRSGLSRIGGDEFVVLLGEGITQLESQHRCARLREKLSRIAWQGQTVGVDCSVGVCAVYAPDVTYDRLYRQADRALYQAKEGGKGRSCYLRLPE